MFVELFMLFTCIDSYQKNSRISELEIKNIEREMEEKYRKKYLPPKFNKEKYETT